ncbi:response regulator transcription factor [uncultured Cocleimonas sp.]|uniref:response regulator transcription factor n=1 Tax=uncultured Cocleimonas sp. TaxID=1051587 RepID=UPI00261FDE75|nr:response regulator [uncultured Cocleimonas sp.]
MPETKLQPTIAIVDDDESILDSLKMVLEDQEWNAQTYISGESFLADFEQHVPDCIILDSHFPGKNGADVVRFIKTINKSIPIIVLTAYPKSQETNEIMELGATEVLAKPIKAEVLIDHVQRIFPST